MPFFVPFKMPCYYFIVVFFRICIYYFTMKNRFENSFMCVVVLFSILVQNRQLKFNVNIRRDED